VTFGGVPRCGAFPVGSRQGSTGGRGSGDAARVTLPNGKGVSLKTGGRLAYDPAPTVEALAFDGSTYIGESERSASVEWCASMLDDLK